MTSYFHQKNFSKPFFVHQDIIFRLGQFEVVARQSHRLKRQIIGNTNREKNYDTLYKHSPYNHSFRKTEGTSFKQRKCERELVKNAVRGTNDRVLMSLYQSDKKGTKTVQMALNTK